VVSSGLGWWLRWWLSARLGRGGGGKLGSGGSGTSGGGSGAEAELADMAAMSADSEAFAADASAQAAEAEDEACLVAETSACCATVDPRTMATKREPNDGAVAGSTWENAVTSEPSLFLEMAVMSEPMERGVHEADRGGVGALGNPGSSAIVLLGGASVSQAERLPDFGV